MLGEGIHTGTIISREDNFLFWTLIGLNITIYAITITRKPGYMKLLFNTALFNRYLWQNDQESLHLNKGLSWLMSFSYFLAIGAFIYRYFHLNMATTLIAIAAGIGIMLIKFLSILMLSRLSKTRGGLLEHLLNHHIFFQISSIVLTIILIFSIAIPHEFYLIFIYFFLAILLISIFFREIQSLIRAIQVKISILYIILYLCTLEILPFIVIIRVFVSENAVLN